MAIGSNFQESLQKALASMEEDLNGLNSIVEKSYEECKEEILYQLTFPGPKRLFYVCDAIRACLLYTSPSPRDATLSRMPSSA